MAVWSTLFVVLLMGGAFAELLEGADADAAGMVIGLLLYVPAIVGTALSVSALERRLGNTPAIWGAVVWNSLVLAGALLLSVVGLTMM